MRTLKALLGVIAFYAMATPAFAQIRSTIGHVIITDSTDDGVPEQLNTPQGLVVLAHLVGNGGSIMIENRSWQRLVFSQAEVDVGCSAIQAGVPGYRAHATLSFMVLESTQTGEARAECRENYVATFADVWITGQFPSLPARSRPLIASTAHTDVYFVDYTYDGVPVQMIGANNVQTEASLRNQSADFSVRNRGSIPIKIERLTASVSCVKKRLSDPLAPNPIVESVRQRMESTPGNELWVSPSHTISFNKACPTGLVAAAAHLFTNLD